MSDILAERHLRARDPPSLGVADRLPGGGRLLLGRRTAFLISLGGGGEHGLPFRQRAVQLVQQPAEPFPL